MNKDYGIKLIVDCRNLNNSNYPSIDFIKQIIKIVDSLILKQQLNLNQFEVFLCEPNLYTKFYFFIFKVFASYNLQERIKFIETESEFFEAFGFNLKDIPYFKHFLLTKEFMLQDLSKNYIKKNN